MPYHKFARPAQFSADSALSPRRHLLGAAVGTKVAVWDATTWELTAQSIVQSEHINGTDFWVRAIGRSVAPLMRTTPAK